MTEDGKIIVDEMRKNIKKENEIYLLKLEVEYLKKQSLRQIKTNAEQAAEIRKLKEKITELKNKLKGKRKRKWEQ